MMMPTAAEQWAAFDRMDVNGTGLSMAEVDKAVRELWPAFDHKPGLMRAYKAAKGSYAAERSVVKKAGVDGVHIRIRIVTVC